MIDKDRVDRHLIVKKEKEETTITSNYSSTMLDEEVIFRALGYSFFELLKNRNVIFEGWSDKFTFQKWIESNKEIKKNWKDIGMIHALGAKDVERVSAQLENFNRECFIITDADEPSLEWQKKYGGLYNWITYKDLGFENKETIEDFINVEYVQKMIMFVLQKEQLYVGVSLDECSTFNSKMKKLDSALGVSKEEFKRLKTIIKNTIFENFIPKSINLEELINAVNILADDRFQPKVRNVLPK